MLMRPLLRSLQLTARAWLPLREAANRGEFRWACRPRPPAPQASLLALTSPPGPLSRSCGPDPVAGCTCAGCGALGGRLAGGASDGLRGVGASWPRPWHRRPCASRRPSLAPRPPVVADPATCHPSPRGGSPLRARMASVLLWVLNVRARIAASCGSPGRGARTDSSVGPRCGAEARQVTGSHGGPHRSWGTAEPRGTQCEHRLHPPGPAGWARGTPQSSGGSFWETRGPSGCPADPGAAAGDRTQPAPTPGRRAELPRSGDQAVEMLL